MKRLTKRIARRHEPRTMAHVTHPRCYVVMPPDAADILEPMVSAPFTAVLTGGDLDADCMRAWDCGDEAVGGSVATPDQDIVDDLGRAFGIAPDPDAEVWTSNDILRERDRHRWQQEE
jgi:uncharacterized protein DUF6335